jgi:hypothetical protein
MEPVEAEFIGHFGFVGIGRRHFGGVIAFEMVAEGVIGVFGFGGVVTGSVI